MRKLSRALAAALIGATLSSGAALSAGSFDGNYKGGVPASCGLPSNTVTLTVANGEVRGTDAWSNGSAAIAGKVEADGSFHGTIGPGRFSGKFEGKNFDADYATSGGGSTLPGCKRHMHLERQN